MMRRLLVLLLILSLLKDCFVAKNLTELNRKKRNFWIWNKVDFFNLNGQVWQNSTKVINKERILKTVRNSRILVAVYTMDPYVLYYPSNSTLSGFLGDLWNILENSLHFKYNITTAETFIKTRDMVKIGEVDVFLGATVYTSQTTNMYFSQPYFQSWFHLYFKPPEGRPARYLHFKAFSAIWMHLLLFYIFWTLMLWLTCFILKKFVSTKFEVLLSLPTYFMGVTAAFFNTGYDLGLRSCSARLQIILALLFGILCYAALSANLVANLAILNKAPLSSLEDVSKQNSYALCLRNITFVYDNFVNKHGAIYPKWKNIVNNQNCPTNLLSWRNIPEAICKDNVIIFENKIIMKLALRFVKCPFYMIPQRYFSRGNFIVFSKKFKFRKVISYMMLRIWSTGIRNKLESKWLLDNLPNNFASQNNIFYPITFSHIRDLINIYWILMLISLIILGLEMIFKKIIRFYKRRNFETR